MFTTLYPKDDQEPNWMEFFKETHYSGRKGWSLVESQSNIFHKNNKFLNLIF